MNVESSIFVEVSVLSENLSKHFLKLPNFQRVTQITFIGQSYNKLQFLTKQLKEKSMVFGLGID